MILLGYAAAMSPLTRARATRPASGGDSLWLAPERTRFLIDHLGGVNSVARTLGVSNSQPSRWKDGTERPGFEAAKRLLGLDYVLAFALLVWEEPVALEWLESANSFLDGARPIDVLAERGPREVVEALDAAYNGAYA